ITFAGVLYFYHFLFLQLSLRPLTTLRNISPHHSCYLCNPRGVLGLMVSLTLPVVPVTSL
ncbi:hypothetical protein J6590_095047, partial [Homalodisca vitripennis]